MIYAKEKIMRLYFLECPAPRQVRSDVERQYDASDYYAQAIRDKKKARN